MNAQIISVQKKGIQILMHIIYSKRYLVHYSECRAKGHLALEFLDNIAKVHKMKAIRSLILTRMFFVSVLVNQVVTGTLDIVTTPGIRRVTIAKEFWDETKFASFSSG